MAEAQRTKRLYGRRRGRPLREGQRQLKEALLARLVITLPDNGSSGNEPAANRLLDLVGLFEDRPASVWLEIGFGAGEHLAAQAERHREIGFIGCEVFENGVVRLLGEVKRRALSNVRVFCDDARFLLERLPPAAIDRVFILFPDPWPKARHHKRRLIAPPTLARLATIMRSGAELRLATDDPDYLCWMLAHLTEHRDFIWLARHPADWREPPPDWPGTRYEAKARAAGRTPVFLRFARR